MDRLLQYIEKVACETLPPEADDKTGGPPGQRVFQLLLDPDDPNFDDIIRLDLSDILRTRKIHLCAHTPTCFKYRSKKCRAHFPHAIVEASYMDPETGIIRIIRNNRWLNNFCEVLLIILRGNHNVQYLYTKDHALATVHYVMKYITKAEEALHSKLTIAAAVRRAIPTTPANDVGRMMVLKMYNKLDSHREVGVPEALSHLLGFKDHYTDMTFTPIHTTHLLTHMLRLDKQQPTNTESQDNMDSEMVSDNRGKFWILRPFCDYAYRGKDLDDYCLFDYYADFYKYKRKGGLPFDQRHPLYQRYTQHLR
jgi:hypothetical protein